MRPVAVITARMASTRLDRKVLREVGGLPMVAHPIRRASAFPGVVDGGGVVLAIPESEENDELVSIGEEFGAKVVRGDEDDVLGRILHCAETVGADVLYRVTGDNPLVDPGVMRATWTAFVDGVWDYTAMDDTPLGTTGELVSVDALKRARELATTQRLKEHPTLPIYENPERFRIRLLPAPDKWKRPDWRFTVDTESDLEVVERIFTELGVNATLDTIVPFLDDRPEITAINTDVAQDGWKSLKRQKDHIGYVST